jgi:hypothetical protein
MHINARYINSIVTILFIVTSTVAYGQDGSFSLLEFKTKADYKKFEPQVLQMAEFALNTPLNNDQNSSVVFANIVQWMSGTPDHHFVMDNSIIDLSKNNESVLRLYMAAATKAALKNGVTDAKALKLSSFEILLDYCANKENGVKQNKEMKKALEAKSSGKLKEYLNI